MLSRGAVRRPNRARLLAGGWDLADCQSREWLISTPKHIELYQAFEWSPPRFAHLGLLVNQEGQKLSKRHGGFDMEEYKQEKGLACGSFRTSLHSMGGDAEASSLRS